MRMFLMIELDSTCKACNVWNRRTTDDDGYDIGYCEVFNRLTVEHYDCSIVYNFLRVIGYGHTTKCDECELKMKEAGGGYICDAKRCLGQDGFKVLDEATCPIRLIYKYINKLQEE